jgi:hypothetical protein
MRGKSTNIEGSNKESLRQKTAVDDREGDAAMQCQRYAKLKNVPKNVGDETTVQMRKAKIAGSYAMLLLLRDSEHVLGRVALDGIICRKAGRCHFVVWWVRLRS